MHFHYFVLEKIAAKLQSEVVGGIFAEAFTQERDQVVLGLGTPEKDFWLRVSCGSPIPFIWPMQRYNRAKRNVRELFSELYGKRIQKVWALAYERVLVLDLEDGYQVAMKMHGLHSNVLILKNGQVIERFRQHNDGDLEFQLQRGQWNENSAEAKDEELGLAQRLRSISPVLEKQFEQFVQRQMEEGNSFEASLNAAVLAAKDEQYFISRGKNRIQFLLFENGEPNLIPLNGLENSLNTFFKTFHQYQGYAKTYEAVKRPLEKHIQKYRGQIDSFYTSIDTITNERPPEEIGHILMANLHLLQQGLKEVELLDFYNDKPLKIKLKQELNPQQNAEQYYQKQKKHKSRMKHLEEQIERLESELANFLEAEQNFKQFPSPDVMEITSEGMDHALLKSMNAFASSYLDLIQAGKPVDNRQKHGFLEFRHDGYVILCGKNAKQNDALTFAYSKKEDTWMHARDCTGSHVIIRNPTAAAIPGKVIEFAASIAAKFSKRKGESLVPVQYTERKYVRKVKNGAPGQVIVEREKVVMVEPIAQLPESN